MSLFDTLPTPPLLTHSPELTTSTNNQANKKDLSLLTLDSHDQNALMTTASTEESLGVKQQQSEQGNDTLNQQQQHHHHHHHHYYHHHHHHIQASSSKSAVSHRDNTSLIVATNQASDCVAAYTYTPITTPSSSPLITPTDPTDMSDDIITTTTHTWAATNTGVDKEDGNIALMESKKKSIKSRFKEVLKKSNLSSKTGAGGVLPSSSSPIPNNSQHHIHRRQPQQPFDDIGKRHSTSSALLKKAHHHLQHKHDSKARSWHPPPAPTCFSTSSPILSKGSQQQWAPTTNSNDSLHLYHHYHIHHLDSTTPQSPSSNATISPLFLASPLVGKDGDEDDCSPSSSSSSLTTSSPLTPNAPFNHQLKVTTVSDGSTGTTTMKVGTLSDNGMQLPSSPSLSPTPFTAETMFTTTSSMPPSRFLTAFQKLRQQKPTLDPTTITTTTQAPTGSMTSPIAPSYIAPRSSFDAISITPSPSVAATVTSKSTSFAEKIKTRFQSNTNNNNNNNNNKLDQRPSSRLPTPVSSKSVATKATKKKSTTSTYRPRGSPPPPQKQQQHLSTSSASPMAQSWSHFSRSFVPSCSVQHASSRYSPKKSKQDKVVASSPQQNRADMGKVQRTTTTPPDRSSSPSLNATNKKLTYRKQQQQQQGVKTTVATTKQQEMERITKSTIKSSQPPCKTQDDTLMTNTTSTTLVYGHSFDADTRVIQGNMIISPTCSTSSHHSSSTTLSVTVSTSSLSESPEPLDSSVNQSVLSLSASSTASFSSNLTFASAQSSIESSPPSSCSLAPVILSSPTPTATKTNTSTNPSAVLTSNPRLTLKSPKRSITEPIIKNNNNNNKPALKAAAPIKTKATDNQAKKKKKKLHVRFISTAKVQDTFSKHDYDRASDPYAVCTHLTAHLAQQIKDELNAYKLDEMLVHHLSRGNTQFFV